MKKLITVGILALVAVSAQAQDIVDTAVVIGSFKTLAAALQAVGLVDTLKGKSPVIVFASADEVIAVVPKVDLAELLKVKATLTAGSTHRAVAGKFLAKDIKVGKFKTVQDRGLTVATTGGITVDAAKGTPADLAADNGLST